MRGGAGSAQGEPEPFRIRVQLEEADTEAARFGPLAWDDPRHEGGQDPAGPGKAGRGPEGRATAEGEGGTAMRDRIRRRGTGMALLAAAAVAAFAVQGGAEERPAPDRAEIERIVRDYLVANPEVIEEAMYALRAKRDAARRQVVRNAIGENRDAILSHPETPVSGNPDGDVTLVEFFDYQCGFCRRELASMKELLAGDGNLRVAWKELPVLGPVSRFAARAAMASARQGRYHDFHVALMGAQGKLTEGAVMAVAERVGLDAERLRRDMADPAIEACLDETAGLARTLGIDGAPAFVIGDAVVPGAVGIDRLRRLMADVRAGG